MRYLLLLLPLMLFGCADSSTTGTNREYDIRVDISGNSGPVSLTFPLTVDATSSTDQTTEGEASIAPDVNLQLVQPGATGSLSGADSVLKDTVSRFQNILQKDAEKEAVEQLPGGNTITTHPLKIEPEEPAPQDLTEEPAEQAATSKTYDSSGFANGRQGWRIPLAGKDYNTPLIFTFSSGFQRTVDDLSKRIEDSNGFLIRPGYGDNRAGNPSEDREWTSHGGMYVHAPYNDTSKSLTITELAD